MLKIPYGFQNVTLTRNRRIMLQRRRENDKGDDHLTFEEREGGYG